MLPLVSAQATRLSTEFPTLPLVLAEWRDTHGAAFVMLFVASDSDVQGGPKAPVQGN